jgi:hypothetical protein
MEILMSKPKKIDAQGRSAKSNSARHVAEGHAGKGQKPDAASKQARVIAMLRSSNGATIAAIMQATEWQQHSVRGFLAGVVRKKLKLKLQSNKVDDIRVYRIVGNPAPKSRNQKFKLRAA